MPKKRGDTYHTDFQVNGVRIRRSTGTGDFKQAKEVEDKLKARLWEETKLNKVHFATAAREYFKTREGTASYVDDVKRILRLEQWLDLNVDDVDRRVIGNITAGLLERGLAKPTTNRYLNVLSAILNYSEDRGWLSHAPKVKRLSEPPSGVQYLTPDEASRFIENLAHEHQREVVRFAIATGLRISNITKLEWSDVDMFRRTIRIKPEDYKARREIILPLHDVALEVLKRRHRECIEGRVFLYNGKPFNRVGQKSFKKAAHRAGIEKNVHPHLFRHTFASWHIMNGATLPELMELGGWSKVESVLRYAHLSVEHLRGVGKETFNALNVTKVSQGGKGEI